VIEGGCEEALKVGDLLGVKILEGNEEEG